MTYWWHAKTTAKLAYQRSNRGSSEGVRLGNKIFAEGTFKIVYTGTYTNGPRKGEAYVWKQFKAGRGFEDYYFDEELAIVECAQRIIDDFQAARIIDRVILLNTPEVWEQLPDGSLGLVEPMIENFEKFNSNTGWAPKSGNLWGQAMQALSHFS